MEKDENTKILEERYPMLYCRMLQYLKLYSNEEEFREITNTNAVLKFEIDGGVFTINYIDLAERALMQMKYYSEENDGVELPEEFKALM